MDLSNVLSQPQGFIRLILALILMLGAIGMNPFLITQQAFNWTVEVILSMTLGGGCLVAISLLLAGGGKQDNSTAEFIFSAIYAIFSMAMIVKLTMFLMDSAAEYSTSVGMILLAIALFGGFILWVVLLAFAMKELFC